MGVAVGGVWSPQATDRMMTMIPAAIQLLDISNISLMSKMAASSILQRKQGCLPNRHIETLFGAEDAYQLDDPRRPLTLQEHGMYNPYVLDSRILDTG